MDADERRRRKRREQERRALSAKGATVREGRLPDPFRPRREKLPPEVRGSVAPPDGGATRQGGRTFEAAQRELWETLRDTEALAAKRHYPSRHHPPQHGPIIGKVEAALDLEKYAPLLKQWEKGVKTTKQLREGIPKKKRTLREKQREENKRRMAEDFQNDPEFQRAKRDLDRMLKQKRCKERPDPHDPAAKRKRERERERKKKDGGGGGTASRKDFIPWCDEV